MNDLLKVNEVAKMLRVDQTTVRRWIHWNVLSAITLPHGGKRECYRIKRETMSKLLDIA